MTKKTLFPANRRGYVNFGWLKSFHSFSFGSWYDPDLMGFGKLRVLNDDSILGGTGFDTHPHENMEIVTIPLEGELRHKDSTGGSEVLKTGEVQIMSAGTGIFHSEFNASETEVGKFLQIWVLPKRYNIAPRYDQKTFSPLERINKFQLLVSPNHEESLWINQDAYFSRGDFAKANQFIYQKNLIKNLIFILVINGLVEIDGTQLGSRDAIGIETDEIKIEGKILEDADLLLIEIPKH